MTEQRVDNRFVIGITGITLVLIMTSTPAISQSTSGSESQKRVWTDPDTKLMWATKDSGYAPPTYGLLRQTAAAAYCKNLALADFHDWRLPTIDELEQIYDNSVVGYHIKGGVVKPSGDPTDTSKHAEGQMNVWSQTMREDVEGIWKFDFSAGYRTGDLGGVDLATARALCVRGAPAKTLAAKPTASIDMSHFVTRDGITIPLGASGAPLGNGFAETPLEGKEQGVSLKGNFGAIPLVPSPGTAILRYTGTMAPSSDGKLAGGTTSFKPTQIQTSKAPDKWLRVVSFGLDERGLLTVTDESGAKYAIKVASGGTYGDIEEE